MAALAMALLTMVLLTMALLLWPAHYYFSRFTRWAATTATICSRAPWRDEAHLPTTGPGAGPTDSI